jgi:hypothetical protein
MTAYGKADIGLTRAEWPVLTQSGHYGLGLEVGILHDRSGRSRLGEGYSQTSIGRKKLSEGKYETRTHYSGRGVEYRSDLDRRLVLEQNGSAAKRVTGISGTKVGYIQWNIRLSCDHNNDNFGVSFNHLGFRGLGTQLTGFVRCP